MKPARKRYVSPRIEARPSDEAIAMEIVQAAFRSSQLASDPITNDAVSSAVADAVTDAADRYHLTDATARPILGLLDGVVARMRREVSKIDEQFERFIAGCGG